LGRTTEIAADRQAFYEPEDISRDVRRKVDGAALRNERIDYLSFVPDGEPSLDINIGEEISLLRRIRIPVAVITNASLLWRKDVKEDLQKADLVSLKVDAVSESLWRRINRPHKGLTLNTVLKGISAFAKDFKGTVVSETMLIGGIGYGDEFKRIAEFLAKLEKLNRAYIAIPTRPPTEKWVKPAKEKDMNAAFQVFSEKLGADRVEYLIGYEGNAFAFTGKIEEDLLGIMAVHPMRKDAVEAFLTKANADWRLIEELLREGKLLELEYEGNRYYMRKLPSRREDEK
jgi:wyosine [tRNA(Phe)-imidazoG37] synthetase (radical SAM superfamily)